MYFLDGEEEKDLTEESSFKTTKSESYGWSLGWMNSAASGEEYEL